MSSNKQSPLAVVGVSALFPGSLDKTGFWTDILAGKDLVTEVPKSHWLIEDYYDPDPSVPDKTYAKRGAFLKDVAFDPMTWGVPPSIVPATDTSQLLALMVAKQVLEDAGQGQFDHLDRERMSVILGVTSGQELMGSMASRLQHPIWRKTLREHGLPESEVDAICGKLADNYTPWGEANFPGLLGNVVAGRIANRLDLGGTNCVTDAACASAFSAMHMAANELWMGQSDVVICGGVDTMNDIFMYMCFSKTPALSPTGDCRPFSDQADGTILGEGLSMVALRRLEDAERDGDRIYAVLQGIGSSSDGRAKSVYAPLPAGQAKALRRAYDIAGYSPTTVELVEAHGTGTKAGDAAEFEGLRTVFTEADAETKGWCGLGSVKSQIGHTKSCAGAAGFFKAVMALHHKVLPPTIKVDRPNPKMNISESPFYLNTEARPWVRGPDHPRRAGVSSFGFGGSNFHLAVEEYTGSAKADRLRTGPVELVVFAGADQAAVQAQLDDAATGLQHAEFWRWLAQDRAQAFEASLPCRLSMVVESTEDLGAKLTLAEGLLAKGKAASHKAGVHWSGPTGAELGKVAFLFPGQGSQYLGMGKDVVMGHDAAISAWDRATAVPLDAEVPLHEVVFPRPVFGADEKAAQDARLTATEWAQPAIGVTSLALLAVVSELGLQADCVGGHSFGEIIALHAAGVLSETDAVAVARKRGELMAAAAEADGAMTAVVADIETVQAFLEDSAAKVVVANHNSPTQVVLSGATAAIVDAEKKLDKAGLRYSRLKVATAFHSEIVSPSTVPFGEFLAGVELSEARIPVYANSEAAPYPADADTIRELLANQIARPVRFVEQVEAMHAAGARTFVEVGPGSVLSKLADRVLKGKDYRTISLDRKGRDGEISLAHALAELVAAGAPLELARLWERSRPVVDPRTVKAAPFTLAINGSNYGKPYPPPGGAADLPPPNPERPKVVAPPPAAPQRAPVAASPAVPAPAAAPAASPARVPAAPGMVEHKPSAPRAAAFAPSTPSTPQTRGASAMSSHDQNSWLSAFTATQQLTAEAHASYQRAMADSHVAFLQSVETALQGLTAIATGQVLPARALAVHPAAPALSAPPVRSSAPAPVLAAPAPVAPAPVAYAPAPVAAAPPPVVAAPVPAPVVAAPAAPLAAAPVAPAAGQDLEALMLEVVAESTGYPAEMLSMGMNLEADLGIDSIKRVEILSAVTERAPELPELDASAMGSLQTLGEIVGFMRDQLGGSAVAAPVAAPAVSAPAAPAAGGQDLEALMLEVVAESTGYPAEMLSMGMNLEADLGIDSIKRVEILSAVTERAPELPELDASAMGALQTLGEIVGFMRDQLGGSAVAAPVAAPAAAAPAAAAPARDLEALMLEVVAESTGYPAEMLTMGMNLEADLGIDSIKRVEILSAVTERAPELPELDASAMGALQTLGEIVGFMRKQVGTSLGNEHGSAAPGSAAPGHTSSPAGQTQAAAIDPKLGRFHVTAVPAPPVGLSTSGLGLGTLAITDDGGGIAPALAERLVARGLQATVVDEVPHDATGVIFLGGLADLSGPDAGQVVLLDGFRAAQIVGKRLSTGPGIFVTVQDTGGDFGQSGANGRAWIAGLAGLAKTAAIEWPEAGIKAIDLQRGGLSPEALADRLVAELLFGGPEREVGLQADGLRLTLQATKVPESQGELCLGADDVIVVSGGAKGVTAACVVELARQTRARFLLLGRTKLSPEPAAAEGVADEAGLKRALMLAWKAEGKAFTPKDIGRAASHILAVREVEETLAAISAVGGEATYAPVDVTDTRGVAAAVAQTRERWGRITGFIHGAGVIADKLIVDKTEDQVEWVLGVKLGGLQALMAATAKDDLKAIVMFSSVAGRAGNRGQCDYAMANEVLNKVALDLAAHREGCVVRSLGWGPWAGGMVTPQLKARFEAMGVALIGLDDGAAMLVNSLRSGPDQVEVVLGGAPTEGALLDGGDEAPSATYEVWVDALSQPWLVDHSIRETTVVPVVLAMEWASRAGRAFKPGLRVKAIRDLKVLKGITLPEWGEVGARFQLRVKQISNGTGAVLFFELIGSSGRPHYTARIELTAAGAAAAEAARTPILELSAWEGKVYGDVLFHGPQFQVIEDIDGISAEGISGTLRGVRQAGWEGGWQTDPAALDGGLQLAVLWDREQLDGAFLPTGIKSLTTFSDGPAAGPFRCVVKGRTVGKDRSVTDITFTDEAGAPIYELLGVETHRRPSGA